MTPLVVDASVAVKWAFHDRHREADAASALAVLGDIRDGRVTVLQPPHWLAEVAAVAARLAPRRAAQIVSLFQALELPVAADLEIYPRACELAVALDQHVFDTLYHAVALSRPGGLFLTADARYYRRAVRAGRITLLGDYRAS